MLLNITKCLIVLNLNLLLLQARIYLYQPVGGGSIRCHQNVMPNGWSMYPLLHNLYHTTTVRHQFCASFLLENRLEEVLYNSAQPSELTTRQFRPTCIYLGCTMNHAVNSSLFFKIIYIIRPSQHLHKTLLVVLNVIG